LTAKFTYYLYYDGDFSVVAKVRQPPGEFYISYTLIQRCEHARLALKARPELRVRGEIRREHFDRDAAVQPRVAGALNLPHSAGAQETDNLVGTDIHSRRPGRS
jgi:hypothetical protein